MTALIYSPHYTRWIFDRTHPTQGRRFSKGISAVRMALDEAGLPHRVVQPGRVSDDLLCSVHTPGYVAAVEAGYSDEWSGERLDLGRLARQFVGGTLTGLDLLLAGDALLAVNLPGAKHHAMPDHSSGFCVYADLAIAAGVAVRQGLRVAILDIDAHHGDGTEAILRDVPGVLTYSVHEDGIFPGTGQASDPERHVYNRPLPEYSGDRALAGAVADFASVASAYGPDLLFIAGGADGHYRDPLSSLQYTLAGYETALAGLRRAFPVTPVLFGGAGGYQPDGATPLAWATMVKALASGR